MPRASNLSISPRLASTITIVASRANDGRMPPVTFCDSRLPRHRMRSAFWIGEIAEPRPVDAERPDP